MGVQDGSKLRNGNSRRLPDPDLRVLSNMSVPPPPSVMAALEGGQHRRRVDDGAGHPDGALGRDAEADHYQRAEHKQQRVRDMYPQVDRCLGEGPAYIVQHRPMVPSPASGYRLGNLHVQVGDHAHGAVRRRPRNALDVMPNPFG
jgi:hypothetical protein